MAGFPVTLNMWVKTKIKRRKGTTFNCGSLHSPRIIKGVNVLWFLTADFYEEGGKRREEEKIKELYRKGYRDTCSLHILINTLLWTSNLL